MTELPAAEADCHLEQRHWTITPCEISCCPEPVAKPHSEENTLYNIYIICVYLYIYIYI